MRSRCSFGRRRRCAAVSAPSTADFADALSAVVEQARERGLVSGVMTPGDLLRLPQAITVRERQADVDPAVEAQLGASIEAAVEQALAELDGMRAREGDHLRADLESRRRLLGTLIERLGAASDEGRRGLWRG